jgi:TRAP-type C4-dicarboxylate transport system substrate-binding protein
MWKNFLTYGLIFAALAPAAVPADVHLATVAPKGTSFEQILMAMREKWRNSPGGGVKLTIHPGGVMGGEATVVQRMRVGTIQAAMLSVVGLSAIDESVTALQYMPMMFRSLDELEYVSEALRPALEKRLDEKGFVVLFWADAGWIRFFSKKPAIHPADFKPMKMFVWAGDNRQSDIMKTMGYQPRSLETGDILPNLQTGMIDAVAQPPFFALAGQLYSFAPHMLDVKWAPAVGAAVVDKRTWERIPAETRAALLKSAKEAGEQIKTKSRLEAEQSVESMKKRGLIVHAASPDLETEWRKFAEQLYPKIRGAIVPADRFDEVSRLLQAYRASGGKAK